MLRSESKVSALNINGADEDLYGGGRRGQAMEAQAYEGIL